MGHLAVLRSITFELSYVHFNAQMHRLAPTTLYYNNNNESLEQMAVNIIKNQPAPLCIKYIYI